MSVIHVWNIENIVPSWLSLQWFCSSSCAWAHDLATNHLYCAPCYLLECSLVHQYKQRVIVHHVLLYMSYYKPTVVITGRAYRFHDFMIYNTHHASARLRTFCVVDHLWKLIFCFLLSFLSIFLIHWNQHCIIVHHISKYINCYKAIVVMTQRVHCFHGFIYTLRSFCFCKA